MKFRILAVECVTYETTIEAATEQDAEAWFQEHGINDGDWEVTDDDVSLESIDCLEG